MNLERYSVKMESSSVNMVKSLRQNNRLQNNGAAIWKGGDEFSHDGIPEGRQGLLARLDPGLLTHAQASIRKRGQRSCRRVRF